MIDYKKVMIDNWVFYKGIPSKLCGISAHCPVLADSVTDIKWDDLSPIPFSSELSDITRIEKGDFDFLHKVQNWHNFCFFDDLSSILDDYFTAQIPYELCVNDDVVAIRHGCNLVAEFSDPYKHLSVKVCDFLNSNPPSECR